MPIMMDTVVHDIIPLALERQSDHRDRLHRSPTVWWAIGLPTKILQQLKCTFRRTSAPKYRPAIATQCTPNSMTIEWGPAILATIQIFPVHFSRRLPGESIIAPEHVVRIVDITSYLRMDINKIPGRFDFGHTHGSHSSLATMFQWNWLFSRPGKMTRPLWFCCSHCARSPFAW